MISSAQVREIEARLAGSGEMGGGDAPDPFFVPILDKIYDEGSITLAEAEDTANVTSERTRILKLWKDHGGFPGFIRGLLDVIEYRGLAVRNDDADTWGLGPAMVEGETVLVLSPLRGVKNSSVSYTVRTAEQRARRDNDSREQGNIAALAASLMPGALGLRRVAPERLARINKSIDDNGFRDTSPIIIDGLDRIISGRHRLEIERMRYNGAEMWRRQREEALSAYDAVQMAMASNEASPWDSKDYKRLDTLGLQGTKTQRLRQKIELALLEDASRSDRALCRLLDCGRNVITDIRRNLQATGRVQECHQSTSDKHINHSTIEAALLAEPHRSNRDIGRLFNCGHMAVLRVRKGLEANGLIDRYIFHGGGAPGKRPEGAIAANKERAREPVPENIKQALIDNPTLNHAAIARKIGERPLKVAQCCARLIAEGAYDTCGHHLLEGGLPVHQTRQGGRKPASAVATPTIAFLTDPSLADGETRVSSTQIHASPNLLPNGDGDELQKAYARIAELEAELAVAHARIAELESETPEWPEPKEMRKC